jgi:hypothetical protein
MAGESVVSQEETLALPQGGGAPVADHALLKIGARMVRHGRCITFQLAEVAVSRQVFGQILARIARLRALPVPA